MIGVLDCYDRKMERYSGPCSLVSVCKTKVPNIHENEGIPFGRPIKNGISM